MNTAASALFTYVNLQMAAESIQIREGYSGAIDPDWLRFGIQRASPPPYVIIPDVISSWTIAAHCVNTPTGFSATLFTNGDHANGLSIRSTELLNNSIRDARDADDPAIKSSGLTQRQLTGLSTSEPTRLNPLVEGDRLGLLPC
jgi:hypothetical protein